MPSARHANKKPLPRLVKTATGIKGLDTITGGGLPKGRPTLITGGPGCGKTLLGMEFLVRGATEYGQPGVFLSFEESEQELTQNVASLGFNLPDLAKRKMLSIDVVRAERSEIEETGEYDLEGLFVRLDHAIGRIKAKRVVLDTIETLFATLSNQQILRAELRRLFSWLKNRGVTAIITAERGGGTLTRHGLEEYVSDCVILLDHRVIEQVSTRRLRVVKYRGSVHGTNEYPFLIDETGFSVMPITSLTLDHRAPTERISTGIVQLDAMLGGMGLYRGGSVLISGTPGSGKTSIAAHMVNGACARGEHCLYFSFEESQDQILRNMQSIGLDLRRWAAKDLLRFHSARPHLHGLEMHLAVMHKQIAAFAPSLVAIDPISNLTEIGTVTEAKIMLTRIIDFLKARGITAVFTSLTAQTDDPEKTEVGISSLIDTWILVRNLESNGERNRGLCIVKSRGMGHSNQIREFTLSDQGAELREVYTGSAGVLTGTARTVQETRDKAEQALRQREVTRKQRELASKREALEAQIEALRASYNAQASELEADIEEDRRVETTLDQQKTALTVVREGRGITGNSSSHKRKDVDHGQTDPRSRQGNGRKERTRTEAR